MQKALKNIFAVFLSILVLSSIVLRIVQLAFYSNIQTGFAVSSSKNSIVAFYIICALIIAFCGIITQKTTLSSMPFKIKKSKFTAVICYLTGASLFYDFIHQCVNCYKYIAETSSIQFNYIIPNALLCVSALLCTYYFYVLGSSFKEDKFDFTQLKFFHLTPTIWMFFGLLMCFVKFVNTFYAIENFLQYLLLIFGIVFYILMVNYIIDSNSNLKKISFFGIVYSIFSVIISVPRIFAWILGIQISVASFSEITYLFTGIFAFTISVNILNQKKD